MRSRYFFACVVALLNIAAYPAIEHLADLERGYDSNVIGGEEALFVAGFFIAYAIAFGASQAKKENTEKSNIEEER